MKKYICIVAVSVAFAGIASAQQLSDTTAGTATATVITPISISSDSDLLFGTFAVDVANGGTVDIAANGTRSATISYIDMVSSTVGAAAFTVTGDASAAYAYTVADATLYNANGIPADNMLATLEGLSTSTSSATAGTLGGGTDTITVFGSLAVAAGQTIGLYSGNFDVTVTYN